MKQLTAEDFNYLKTAYKPNKPITGDYDKSLAVKCVNGTFVGKKNEEVLSFKGIPYVGEQPIGKNRFKNPVPFKEDNGVYEAYYFGKSCPQPYEGTEPSVLYETGEDCLYLNVFKNANDTTPNKPVMFWVHGGAWQFGGAVDPLYDMSNFVTENPDVIVVTINYRLGMLGYTHLSHLPGGEAYPEAQNNGVLDQMMALKWVHENIANFGGDPSNVTIYGQSAGGCGVSVLALIPEARQYFHRVIAMSGAFQWLRTPEMAKEFTRAAMEYAGVTTIQELVDLPIDKLIEASTVKYLRTYPERDGILLPSDPYAYMASGVMKDIDFMEGSSRDENNYFCFAAGGNKEEFGKSYGALFDERFATIDPEKVKKAREFMAEVSDDKYEQVAQFGTMIQFGAPAIRQSEEMTKGGGRVFHYFLKLEAAEPGMGAMHSVEMSAVFANLDYQLISFRDIDLTFARIMQRFWVNFAKTGNPSIPAEESPTGKAITWEQYSIEKKPVMVFEEFNVHQSTVDECKIVDWERVYPLTDEYVFLPD